MKKIAENLSIFILLFSTNFIFLLPISLWIVIKIFPILIGAFILFNPQCVLKAKGKFTVHSIFFIYLIICEIIITKLRYNLGNINLLATSISYFVILLYFILVYYRIDKEKIIKIFINLTLILSLVLILQFLVYEIWEITFLSLDLGSFLRFGEVRIGEGAFIISIGVILAIAKIINSNKLFSKENSINIVTVILGLADIIFVAKTRSILLFLIVSVFIMLIITIKNKIKIISVCILCSLIFISSPIMKKYIELNNNEEWSTIARRGAIEYYLEQAKDMPIFGTGMINPGKDDELFYYARGPQGIFYRDDVGIIGLLNGFGAMGVLWYIILLASIAPIILKKIKMREISSSSHILGLFMFLLLCSTTIIFTDPQRLYLLPYILYMIEEA